MSTKRDITSISNAANIVEVTTIVALVTTTLVIAYAILIGITTTTNDGNTSTEQSNKKFTRKSHRHGTTDGGIKIEYKTANNNSNSKLTTTTTNHEPLHLSKKGMKKQLKYERKVQNRKQKRQVERNKRHQEALRNGRDIQQEQDYVIQRTLDGDGWRRRQIIWENEKLSSVQTSFHICIDCSYEQYMTKKEITSLAAQIRCCYSYNKRNKEPCQMIVSNLSMLESPQTLQLLIQEKGYTEWTNRAYNTTSLSPNEYYSHPDTIFQMSNNRNSSSSCIENNMEHRRMSKLVYLTSDSNTTLTTLDNDTVYIIGGIVDRNRYKGIAYDRAQSLMVSTSSSSHDNKYCEYPISISTAKLPLMEYITYMPSTPVLTINHVFHILLQYRNNNNKWNTAFQNVLPARKEAQYRDDRY